ncbi:MAG: methionine--tRNA ligase [Bacteriovoracaceae bacterium]|nr:methionine--tRNA ligase [Bacteriovoracaceae bacterium]
MDNDKKKYLITSALPYANGPLHFGHLAGVYLPADTFTRHHKLLGHNVLHISGSDEHGVAIMLNAQREKRPYKEYVDSWHQEHKELFDQFNVHFDYFGQTSADYHTKEVIPWFTSLYDKGLIEPRDSQQLQCKSCTNHLPDRFVKGTCYSCDYKDARGDECPNCGIIIDSVKLKNPICQICESTDISEVTVTQYYLLLSKYHNEFQTYLNSKKDVWRKTVFPFVQSLIKDGLHDRAITRDLDWGIDVPLNTPEAKGKKLYVWFDAPIGYVSNTKQLFMESGRDKTEDYIKDWWGNEDTEIVHFIGKDNIIFHCIIFPCMSMASELINPGTDVPSNQYLNLEGKQFSKSAGWYVDAKEALDQFGSDALRYYLFSILPDFSDSSFTWEGFQTRVNGELANNVGNLVSRCLKFWNKNWSDGLEAKSFDNFFNSKLKSHFENSTKEIHHYLNDKNIKKALESLMALSQTVNTYFSDLAPWAQIKTDENAAKETIGVTAIQILILGILFEPFLPELSKNIIKLYGDQVSDEIKSDVYKANYSSLKELFSNTVKLVAEPKVLVPKIDKASIAKFQESLRAKTQ